MVRGETVVLVPKESVESIWARRVLQPIVISILALSVGGVMAFFQKGDHKEPLVLVVPSFCTSSLGRCANVSLETNCQRKIELVAATKEWYGEWYGGSTNG